MHTRTPPHIKGQRVRANLRLQFNNYLEARYGYQASLCVIAINTSRSPYEYHKITLCVCHCATHWCQARARLFRLNHTGAQVIFLTSNSAVSDLFEAFNVYHSLSPRAADHSPRTTEDTPVHWPNRPACKMLRGQVNLAVACPVVQTQECNIQQCIMAMSW